MYITLENAVERKLKGTDSFVLLYNNRTNSKSLFHEAF